MRYKIDDKEDEYLSLLYEDWIDMLGNLDTKDNRKRYSAYNKYKASTPSRSITMNIWTEC